MADTENYVDREDQAWRLVLILLGAVSGTASIAILTGFWQEDMILSPILGVISILLLTAGGIIGRESD